MNAKNKFIVMTVINCLLIFVFLYVATREGWDLSRRLIDLDITKSTDFKTLLAVGVLSIGGLAFNFALIAARRIEASIEDIVKACEKIGLPDGNHKHSRA